MRQEPKEALVTTEGKEKSRKPIDPPPIVQLSVDSNVDPLNNFLQNPYIFLSVSLHKEGINEPVDAQGEKSLAGTLVSSLHRLKDVDNKDGGYFVFGDISVKITGTYRLHFSLYEFQCSMNEVQYLGSVNSAPFQVQLAKDFKGMDESTYLSRAFSDQGVRLRLRKEPRGLMGTKRGYPFPDSGDTPIRPALQSEHSSSYDSGISPNKRYKTEPNERKDSFPESANASVDAYQSRYNPSTNYATPSLTMPRQSNITNANVAKPTSYNSMNNFVPGGYGLLGNGGAASWNPQFSRSIGSNTGSLLQEAPNSSMNNALTQPQSGFMNIFSPFSQRSAGPPGVDFSDALPAESYGGDSRYTAN